MEKSRSSVELVAHDIVCSSYYRLDRYRLRHRLFEGCWSEEIQRDVFERGNAATVLLFDPARKHVVLVEQFRTGVYAAGDQRPWTLETVAGAAEEGEDMESLVRREAQEEAGVSVGPLIKIPGIYPTPGACSEFFWMFCGRVDSSTAKGVHGKRGEGEDIRVVVMTLDEALSAIENSEIQAGYSVVALQWLALNQDKVLEAWA